MAERLFEGVMSWLRPGGAVAVEIREESAVAVCAAAARAGLVRPFVRQDLAGRDRVVGAWRRDG
jgi:methylase of polypeptide subunit release factors